MIPESVRSDGRRNLQDDAGNMWYVTSTEMDKHVAGPFGSNERAWDVAQRVEDDYPGRCYPEPNGDDQ